MTAPIGTGEHDPACSTAHGDRPGSDTSDRALIVVYATPLGGYLTAWGRELGFDTTLFEPDPAAVTNTHRDDAGRVVHAAADLEVAPDVDVVVTDHHRGDLGPTMAPLVRAGPRSIGIIGSPRHTGPHEAALADEGVPAELIATVRRPIGLDIGSKTPAEIACSILGGLLAERNGKTGGLPAPVASETVHA